MPRALGFATATPVMQLRVSALSPPAVAERIATFRPIAFSGDTHCHGNSPASLGRDESGMSWIVSNISGPIVSRTHAISSPERGDMRSRTVEVSVITS